MIQLYRWAQGLWQKKPFRWMFAACAAALVGVAAGRAVKSISGSVSVVEGRSMAPTYESGARVYTAPITTPVERGDIVLVDDGHADFALKRIVGMPLETVILWRGYVFINRKMLREPYLPKHTYTFPSPENELCVFELGEDQYFVMGDNRLCSVDSRAYGPIQRKRIKSRVPPSETTLRGHFAAYTLPEQGKRTIRAL
jgi:signal peptidase I